VQWNAAVPRSYNAQTGFWAGRVDDNYWHHVALVVDRTENKMKLYVDGQLQAESQKPANFDVLREHPSYPTRLYAYFYQNLAQDEARILNYARTSEQIRNTWIGNGANLTGSTPRTSEKSQSVQTKTSESKQPLPEKKQNSELKQNSAGGVEQRLR
jgi:hypothetical protein